jgi:hypothetical protein
MGIKQARQHTNIELVGNLQFVLIELLRHIIAFSPIFPQNDDDIIEAFRIILEVNVAGVGF